MNKTLIKQFIALITILFTGICFAQNGSVFFEGNYNTFSNASIKSFQKEFLEDIPEIPIEINDEFPSNIGFTIGYKVDHLNAAFFFSHNSTGGKLSYSDYSGIIRITQLLNAYTLGGEYLLNLSKKNGHFSLGLRGFSMLSTLKLKSHSQILDNLTNETIEFQSINFGVGGRLIYEYPISFIIIRATIGYDITFAGTLKFKDNSDFHLENNNEDPVKTNWTGLRTGLGIAIPF